MKVILRKRDSGKARELLEYAREKNATIVTLNKRAFAVKAKSLGFEDIDIIDYNDFEYDDFDLTKPVLIHNVDHFLEYVIDRYYNAEVIGFSSTVE